MPPPEAVDGYGVDRLGAAAAAIATIANTATTSRTAIRVRRRAQT